jgi:hypothetical protein
VQCFQLTNQTSQQGTAARCHFDRQGKHPRGYLCSSMRNASLNSAKSASSLAGPCERLVGDVAVAEWWPTGPPLERADAPLHVGDCARNREALIRDDGEPGSDSDSICTPSKFAQPMSAIALGANEAQTRSCWIGPFAIRLAIHRRARQSPLVCRAQVRPAGSYRDVSDILERARSSANRSTAESSTVSRHCLAGGVNCSQLSPAACR